MTYISQTKAVVHNIILENREKLSLSGVRDVNNFDEKQIVAYTEMGCLTIKGSALHINKFDTENGELNVTGKINELLYSNKKMSHLSFVEKLFR